MIDNVTARDQAIGYPPLAPLSFRVPNLGDEMNRTMEQQAQSNYIDNILPSPNYDHRYGKSSSMCSKQQDTEGSINCNSNNYPSNTFSDSPTSPQELRESAFANNYHKNDQDILCQDAHMVRVLDSDQPHLIFPDSPIEAKNGKFLRIATWNIRGCNADNKLTELADVAANEGLHILGLAETKMAENVGKNKMATRRDKWMTFWTRDEETPNGSGVGLLVDIQWSKYIQRKNTMNGRVLSLDFCFPGGAHLRVIQVYVPGSSSVPEAKRRDVEVFAADLALSAIAAGSEAIIMGDFNAVAKPAVDRLTNGSAATEALPEREILGRLLDNGFTDTFRARWPRIKDFTWQSSDSRNASRIDLLLCSSELTGRLTASNMALITGSDHRMMCAEFATSTWVTLAGRREVEKRRVKVKRINTKRASEDQWSEFSKEVDHLLPREVDGYPTTGDQFVPWDKTTVLDEAWHAAENAFRTAAQACLPYMTTSKRGCMSRLEADTIKVIAKLGGILQALRNFHGDRSQTNYEKITDRTMKAQSYHCEQATVTSCGGRGRR
jgi:exonuclease III